MTLEEFQIWWNLPQTREVLSRIVEQKEGIVEQILDSNTLSDNAGLTAQLTARAVGEIAGLDYFIKKEFLEE